MDDDDGFCEGRDEAVSIQKRRCEDVAWGWIGIFADECSVFGDRAKQRDVVGGISAPKPRREYGDGSSTGVEAAAVSSGIDAVSAAGDDYASGECELGGEPAGEAECVFIGGAGADNGDRAVKVGKRARKVELGRSFVRWKIEKPRRPT